MKRFLQYTLLAFAVAAVGGIVLSRGLPDSVVDPLEKMHIALDDLAGTHYLTAPNLNSLRKSQSDQVKAITNIAASSKVLQGAVQTARIKHVAININRDGSIGTAQSPANPDDRDSRRPQFP